MRFKIDENLPIEAAEMLADEGHDALTVLDQQMSGDTDDQIAAVCQREKRVVVSLDLDFADIRVYPPKDFAGLIVLRLKKHDKIHVLEVIQRLLKAITAEPIENRLWIVDENRLRIRE